MMWYFWLNNPDKIVVATGDTRQLKNPESVSNVFEFEAFANHCIDLMFKNNIMLYECERLKTDEDRRKLYDVKDMMFNQKEYERNEKQRARKSSRSYKPNPADEQQMKVWVWSKHVGCIKEDYFRLIWIV